MKPGKFSIYLIYIVLSFVVIGCSSKGYLATRNIAGFYKPEMQMKGLAYTVFNLDDSLTRLYFRFPLEDLKYQQITGKKSYASFRIEYQVFDGYEKGRLVDSGSFRGVDSLLYSGIIEDSLILRVVTGKNYIIQATLTDVNASLSFGQYIDLSKFLHNGAADFILTDLNNKPLMRNYLIRNEKVRIRSRFLQDSLLRLIYYKFSEQDAAKAPFTFSSAFSGIDHEPGYREVIFRGYISDPFIPEAEGLYVDQITNGRRLRFCRFYDGFPEIGSVIKMREAARYISTDDEYRIMLGQPPRLAVDDFWTGLTGNPERALSQIKRYYGRVEQANGLFSQVMEGWKSDRGMIYIIFGPPSIVFRNSGVEEWTYGEPGNPHSVRFYFHKEATTGGIEDYILARAEDYRRPWHLAVSNWRR